MPPPSLSMTTMRTGVSTSRRAARPPTSCRSPRSPVRIVVGRPLAAALAARTGLIEVNVDRQSNVEQHRALESLVSQALAAVR